MSGVQQITVSVEDDDLRLDRWFRKYFPGVKHGQLEKLLRKGQIRVDGGRIKASHKLAAEQIIRIPPLPEGADEAAAKRGPPVLSDRDARFIRDLVIYEDEALLILNKPFGLAVQGGSKTNRHIDGMLDAFGKDEARPRLTHRLDRDTGGVLVLGKTRKAAKALGEFFQRHKVEKTYWALLAGVPHPRQGRIDLPIAKKAGSDGEKMGKSEAGKKALTDFQVVEEAGSVSFVALRPLTGRTHQLRVHCAAIGNPVVGDGKYGGPASRIEGIAPEMHLFCQSMTFPHPLTRRSFTVKAELSAHMLATWKFFNFPRKPVIEWPEANLG
jgi:23S rRNA pseudouridine955/2504/2580 synthase